jgi:hypothetical protein
MLTVNFTPKHPNLSQMWQIKCPLKFSAFLNVANIRSHTKVQKNKTMESGRKNKQCSIGIKINLMLTPAYFYDQIPCFFFFFFF